MLLLIPVLAPLLKTDRITLSLLPTATFCQNLFYKRSKMGVDASLSAESSDNSNKKSKKKNHDHDEIQKRKKLKKKQRKERKKLKLQQQEKKQEKNEKKKEEEEADSRDDSKKEKKQDHPPAKVEKKYKEGRTSEDKYSLINSKGEKTKKKESKQKKKRKREEESYEDYKSNSVTQPDANQGKEEKEEHDKSKVDRTSSSSKYQKKDNKRKYPGSTSSQPVDGAGGNAATRNKDNSKNKPPAVVSNASIPSTATQPPQYAFQVDDTDHCETPLKAYQDIVVVLDRICDKLNKSRKSLIVYDPYYCNGGIVTKLWSLGFQTVINRNHDFYNDIATNNVPKYDVLVTNPPYSGIHMEKALQFCYQQQNQPFLLLLPHFVYTKDYYHRSIQAPTATPISNTYEQYLFFLVPEVRYSYVPPSWVSTNSGSKALDKGKDTTAPFPSFWYCKDHGCKNNYRSGTDADDNNILSKRWLEETFGESGKVVGRSKHRQLATSTLRYASCTKDLPRSFKGEFDTSNKRPNPKARKRAAAKKKRDFNHGWY